MNRHMICKPLCKSSENQHNQRPPISNVHRFTTILFFNRQDFKPPVHSGGGSSNAPWIFHSLVLWNHVIQSMTRDGQLTDKFAKARHHSQHRNLDCCIVAKCNSPSLGHFETLFGSTHLGQNWQQTSNETKHGVCQGLSVHIN